jgi:hypothetical protein
MLLLVPFLITLFASLRAWAPPGLGTHALAAFGFVLVLAVITTVDTFLAGVVFRPGTQAYSDLWTRAILPLELLAWGPVFGLALLLASRLFVGHGLERAVRLLLVLAGALCCLNALCFVTGDLRFAWSGIAGYDFVFVAVCVLLVRLFARGRAR